MNQRIVVDLKPISWNQVMNKNHWKITEIKNEWKSAVLFSIKTQGFEKIVKYPVSVHIEARWKYKKIHDIDSLYCKAAIDALVENKYIEDDNLLFIKSVIFTGNIGCERDELVISILTD